MAYPLLRSIISEMVESYLTEGIPSTVSKGRLAVINGKKKIERAGGWYNHQTKTYHIGSKEVGHEENGRSYFEPEIIKKHGFPTLTNAHMDL